MENLDNIIESVLFVAGDPIPISDLCLKFGVDKKEVNAAVEKLQKKHDGASGIKLMKFNNKLQFSSNPDYVEYIAAVLNPIRQRNLTKATLETAAIIAYKQPITRTEIEETRGVNSDYALNILLEHKLVEIVGRKDAVGRPSLFGTTDEFLKRFGIGSISELPDYDELMENIQRLRGSYSDSLFNRFEPVLTTDEDMDKKLEDISKINDENKKFEEATEDSIVIGEQIPISFKQSNDEQEIEPANIDIDRKLAELSGNLDSFEENYVNTLITEQDNINLKNQQSENVSDEALDMVVEDFSGKTEETLQEDRLDEYVKSIASSVDEDYLDLALSKLNAKNFDSESLTEFSSKTSSDFDEESEEDSEEDYESDIDKKLAAFGLDDDIDKRLAALSVDTPSFEDNFNSSDVL